MSTPCSAAIRDAGLDAVGAALDLLSLTADGIARPRGPVTIAHALDLLADAAATLEQLTADRLDKAVGYAEPTPRTRARAERKRAAG